MHRSAPPTGPLPKNERHRSDITEEELGGEKCEEDHESAVDVSAGRAGKLHTVQPPSRIIRTKRDENWRSWQFRL